MGTDQVARKRRAWAGLGVAGGSSLGLIAFPLLARVPLSDTTLFSIVFALVVAMGLGAVLAIFSLGSDHRADA